jgi:hypothetical protein
MARFWAGTYPRKPENIQNPVAAPPEPRRDGLQSHDRRDLPFGLLHNASEIAAWRCEKK